MPTRYHPVLVALHWLLAVMIVLALVFGTFALAPFRTTTRPSSRDCAGT